MTPNITSTPPAASVRFSHWCRLPIAWPTIASAICRMSPVVASSAVVDAAAQHLDGRPSPVAPTSSAETPSAASALPRCLATARSAARRRPPATAAPTLTHGPHVASWRSGRAATNRTRSPSTARSASTAAGCRSPAASAGTRCPPASATRSTSQRPDSSDCATVSVNIQRCAIRLAVRELAGERRTAGVGGGRAAQQVGADVVAAVGGQGRPAASSAPRPSRPAAAARWPPPCASAT